jgi:hypothetical protein
MRDLSHLHALKLHLSHERDRLRKAKGYSEKAFRTAWVAQLEKEIAGEKRHLGMVDTPPLNISDDDLLNELLN